MPEPPDPTLPTGGPAESIGFLLSRVGAWSAERFVARLRPLGLEPKHAAILRIVGTSGGISQQELAQRLGVAASRMVALIDELEGRRLVERTRNPDDRRAYRVVLTDTGRSLGTELAATGQAHDTEVTAPLDADERELLRGLLQRLAALQDLPADAHPGAAPDLPHGEPAARGRSPRARSRKLRRRD